MTGKNVAIGLCTYRRPEQLTRCLQSLGAMARPEHTALCVIIADNDPAGSALEIVDAFRATAAFPVYYEVEKRPGIPCARNNVLRRAAALGITDLAFIDDDEYVEPLWFVTLWGVYLSSGADVTAGYVKTLYPTGTPQWIQDGNFFQNTRHQSSALLMSAATGNVIFNFQKLAVQWNLAFDERFGLAGGSDTDFFFRAAKKGAVITWTEAAVVYELLARERMCLSYLIKNRFRKSNLKLGYAELSLPQKTRLFFGLVRKFICCVLALPFSFFRGFSAFAAVLTRAVSAFANMLALLGCRIRLNEYNDSAAGHGKKADT